MKVKTVVISLAVTGALVAGGIYGAYYVLQSRKSPVEVVPVANVNSGYWGTTNTIYGTVTSQVAQNVTLDEEYAVDEIYVEAGQEVKEGDPLFSYDMTLPELELELKELELQTYELEKTRLERDLERLRNGTYTTASLESNDTGSMTASGGTDLIIEEPGGESGSSGSSQGGGSGNGLSIDSAVVVSESTEGSTEGSQTSTEGSQSSTESQQAASEESGGTGESSQTPETVQETTPGTEAAPSTEAGETEPGIEIESVETVEGTVEAQAGESESETEALTGDAGTFISLYTTIQQNAESGMAGEDSFGKLVAGALDFYHNHLCTASQSSDLQILDALGQNALSLCTYTLSEEAKQAFQAAGISEEEVASYVENLENYGLEYLQSKNNSLAGSSVEGLSAAAIVGTANAEGLLTVPEAVYNSLSDTGKKREAYAYVTYAARLLGSNIQDGLSDKIESVYNAYLLLNDTARNAFNEAAGSDSVLSSAWQNIQAAVDSMKGIANDEYYVRQYTRLLTGTELVSETVYRTGDTVNISAGEIEFYQFERWTVLDANGNEIALERPYDAETTFVMPEGNVTVTADYTVDSAAVNSCVNQFMELAESLQSEGAAQSETYLEALQEAINLYQSMLGSLPADILDESGATMEDYELKQEVWTYTDTDIQTLEDSYKSLCLSYVNALINSLDPQALTREALDEAKNAYEKLGASWSQEITISYLLDAYEVILMIQEIDTTQPAETVTAAVQAAADAYYALTEEGKAAVWNLDVLENLMEQYGIQWPSEEETESELWDDFGDFGDFGDMGMDEGYTSEELQSMIKDTERQIEEKDRQIREAEIELGQSQRTVDGKVVRSTLDGTVVSIGETDGTSEDEYFVKVASAAGLYARGSMNELDLESIHVGDTISGMLMDTGVSFTAEIVEISEYPDTSGESMNYGSENTNASYYPFMALIEDTEEITEGDAELYLTDTVTDYSNIITLENYFIRTENDGRSYVYIQGEDGRLKKQYVELGQEFYAMVVEIRSGLDESDLIAFPYGDDVMEGAATKEVDALTY
ncbi:MAG TPA: hypothetical protein IAB31_10310 [Candidatus Choladousia intestinavium]|uniref:Bacterial repeat domain-containing protein n=1 Tax=Candidatus Choladousia intestinavium TaxID=2840727 RepID=A0A9D1AE65_9FIRM|nr:hypothetical protein [Candidatus Choladousia intestinavium]